MNMPLAPSGQHEVAVSASLDTTDWLALPPYISSALLQVLATCRAYSKSLCSAHVYQVRSAWACRRQMPACAALSVELT